MAPAPSGRMAGATESRLQVGAAPNLDSGVTPCPFGASYEALRTARLKARLPIALDSASTRRESQSTMRMHGLELSSPGLTWSL